MIFYLAGAYVVRKISAAVSGDEQKEQPVLTPCSLAQGKFIYTHDNTVLFVIRHVRITGSCFYVS